MVGLQVPSVPQQAPTDAQAQAVLPAPQRLATKPAFGAGMSHWPSLLYPQATIVPSDFRPRL